MKKILWAVGIAMLMAGAVQADIFTWTGDAAATGNSIGDWNVTSPGNWSGDVAPTYGNTADIKIAGTQDLDQYIRTHLTIRSLEFTSSNLGVTTVELRAANGADRDLTFSADSGNSTLTINAASTGDKTFSNVGEIVLSSNLDIVHNGEDALRFNSQVRGAGNLSITGGLMYLDGANTYTGNTTINAGSTLRTTKDAGSEFAFNIGADGVNNAMLGTGSVFLHTTFVLDLSAASTTVGDEWLILDVDNLTESYRSTFAVASETAAFTEASGVWSINENGVDYEFAESTGTLTVIPEPAVLSLVVIFGGGILVLKRRFS